MIQIIRYLHQCLRCKRAWESKMPEPVACRYCKSYLWNEQPRSKEA